MRRVMSVAVLMYACSGAGMGQGVEEMEKILLFCGVTCPEEVDSYEVERLGVFLSRPLAVNLAAPASLAESGLFTAYQAASLSDYRKRHGDLLSFEELAMVDGFGRTVVERLKPFITLAGGTVPGRYEDRGFQSSVDLKSAWGKSGLQTYGVKYKMKAGKRWSAGTALSRTSQAGSMAPDAFSGYLVYDFRKTPGKVIIGDFNARFGQGLALWNGMGLSGLNSPSSFLKRTSGLTPSSSFNGNYSLRGAALDLTLKNVKLSTFMAVDKENTGVPGLLPAVNIALLRRYGIISMTHYADLSFIADIASIVDMKTSVDLAVCHYGVDLFAEASYDWYKEVVACLAGVVFPIREDARIASMLRFYPPDFSSEYSAAAASTSKCSNEYALTLSGEFPKDLIFIDAAYFPSAKSGDDTEASLQVRLAYERDFQLGNSCNLKLRLAERMRSWGVESRTEARATFTYSSEGWSATLRADAVRASGNGVLGYIEGGHKGETLSIYLRYGMFCIDDWDDRIYVYERDAPGAFNVPAYYGRGLWGAVTASLRYTRALRLYARAGKTEYPFMKSKKSGRAELKLHAVFEF